MTRKRPLGLPWAVAMVALGAMMALGLEPYRLWPLTLIAFALVIAKAVRGQATELAQWNGLQQFPSEAQ